jgi:Glyoxalase-like domain
VVRRSNSEGGCGPVAVPHAAHGSRHYGRVSVERIIGCRLDHLVWAVPDLERGVAQVDSAIGIEPTLGGSHVGLGTANFLLCLDEAAYLEVVGPDASQPQPPAERPFGVDDLLHPRLVTFAVRVENIEATVDELRRLGHDPGEPYAMQRALPDGGTLSSKLTHPPDWAAGVVPFLIEWRRLIRNVATRGGTVATSRHR